MKKQILFGALAVAILLTGCVNYKHKNEGGAAVGDAANGAQSYGTGETTGVDGSSSSDLQGSTLKAPADQIYYFDFDSSTVRTQDVASMNAQATYLAQNPNAHIRLEGNTDERGSREYNIALGERRAQSVAEAMEMNGAKRSQMTIVSYGRERPLVAGHDESAWRQNRRVNLVYEAK